VETAVRPADRARIRGKRKRTAVLWAIRSMKRWTPRPFCEMLAVDRIEWTAHERFAALPVDETMGHLECPQVAF
jgi:hypothetical protein